MEENKTIKNVTAPVRIDFAGGTTDIYPFTHTHKGCVLNAAIDRYVVGKIVKSTKHVSLMYKGNIPTSSGLGTSGAMNLVWLALISEKNKFSYNDKIKLAEKVYNMEQSFGDIGGKQDQYAAAFGGINFLEFNKDKVRVHQLKLSKDFVRKLEDGLVLVYTGKPHLATDSNRRMIENLRKGKNTKNLIRIKNIAIKMKDALLKKDLVKFAELLNDETKERKNLAKHVITPKTKSIINQGIKNGAIAAKICGSGNGGSVLFFGDKKRLKNKFKNKVINFKFDHKGLRVN